MTKLICTGTLALATLVAAASAVAQENVDKMVQELREQARQNPERLDLRLSLGNTAVQAQNYDVALDAFRSVLAALDPNSPEAGDVQLRIGETSRRKGDLEAAAAALRRARDLLPENPTVPGTLALVLDMQGKFPEAEQAYRATLKLDPENAEAMNNLAYLLALHGGRLDEALALATRAHELMAASCDFADTLAVVLTRKGDVAAALPILLDIVGREPADEGFRGHLAAALEQKAGRGEGEQELLAVLQSTASTENVQRITELLARVGK